MHRFAVSTMFAFLLLGSTARAEEAPPAKEAPPPAEEGFQFKGRAIYAGFGAGVLPDLGVATENWRLMATLPVARWAMVELYPYGYHFIGHGRHGDDSVNALGIGAGFRVAPWPDATVRPHLAARFSHIHFWPDPWGDHVAGATSSYDHTSHHRWAGALAAGLDAPLFKRGSRFRIGFDLEATLASGPGTNVGIAGLGTIGFAL